MNEQEEFKGKADVERFLEKSRADMLSCKTLKKYKCHLGLAFRYLQKEPREITLEDIDKWKYEMIVDRKYEVETIWASIVILRKFLRFLGKNDVADKIKTPKRPEMTPPEKEIWLLPEEEKAMIEKSKELSIREYAIMKLFLSRGIRAGELVALDIQDINFEEKLVHIRHGKGNKSRILPIDSETEQALRDYLIVRTQPTDSSNALFTSMYGKRISHAILSRRVKECAVLAGIQKPISAHKLRHTFITKVIEKTKDIPLAQKLAGHAKIKNTMRYHHTTHDEIVANYRKFFDSPDSDRITTKMPVEEIVRGLDAKFIKGELPYEVYMKLRTEYQSAKKVSTPAQKAEYEVAYS
ncbi:MAG: tyrosine-type recombinase/integrase [Candidatus Thermoplasmatota archaeon]|nr:tyrosine-type recombinase/integrase [Candidatus Thermoplasmatota archaeon]